MMRMLFPNSSSSSHYRETGGMYRGMLIASKLSTSLLDEIEGEESISSTNDIVLASMTPAFS
jgi:hypothetical protein